MHRTGILYRSRIPRHLKTTNFQKRRYCTYLSLLLRPAADCSPGLLLDLRQVSRVVGQVGEDHPLLVVVLAQDLVVAQEEAVANAESGKKRKGELNVVCLKMLFPSFLIGEKGNWDGRRHICSHFPPPPKHEGRENPFCPLSLLPPSLPPPTPRLFAIYSITITFRRPPPPEPPNKWSFLIMLKACAARRLPRAPLPIT